MCKSLWTFNPLCVFVCGQTHLYLSPCHEKVSYTAVVFIAITLFQTTKITQFTALPAVRLHTHKVQFSICYKYITFLKQISCIISFLCPLVFSASSSQHNFDGLVPTDALANSYVHIKHSLYFCINLELSLWKLDKFKLLFIYFFQADSVLSPTTLCCA